MNLPPRSWPAAGLIACGVWMLGLGLYFMFLRPALLPEDARFFGRTLAEVEAFAPPMLGWLRHVFTVMGGFMAAAGVLTALAGLNSPRSWITVAALGLAGLLSVGLMSAVNFAIDSDFKWLLAVPPVLWAAALGGLIRKA